MWCCEGGKVLWFGPGGVELEVLCLETKLELVVASAFLVRGGNGEAICMQCLHGRRSIESAFKRWIRVEHEGIS